MTTFVETTEPTGAADGRDAGLGAARDTATLRIAFVGPPGSGKGTQAAALAARRHLVHISTGELLRTIAREESAAGSWVREVMAAGDLIPDGFMLDLVVAEIRRGADTGRGFILDGFPRTVSQYTSLSHRFDGRPLDLVVIFQVDREHLDQRLAGRGRADDAPATIARRLESYRADTVPMIRYMRTTAAVATVDGAVSVDAVRTAIDGIVDEHLAADTASEPAPAARSRKEQARSLLSREPCWRTS